MDILFHTDNDAVFKTAELRAIARDGVLASPLIQRCAQGDMKAVVAFKKGFWPFVRGFEPIIKNHFFDKTPLEEKFDPPTIKRVLVALHRAVRGMAKEEGSHAKIWREDAEGLGVFDLRGPLFPSVGKLLEFADTPEHPQHYGVLAGTEFVAEEIARVLVESKAFTSLFALGRWLWGDTHLLPHLHGASHLEIDLDLARAYASDEEVPKIRMVILQTIELFAQAALEIEGTLVRERRLAAVG